MEYKTFKIGDFETLEPKDLKLSYSDKKFFAITPSIKFELESFYNRVKTTQTTHITKEETYNKNLYPGVFKFLILSNIINVVRFKIQWLQDTLFFDEDKKKQFLVTINLLKIFDNNLNLLLKMENSSLREIENFLCEFAINIEKSYLIENNSTGTTYVGFKNLSFFTEHYYKLDLSLRESYKFYFHFINHNCNINFNAPNYYWDMANNWKKIVKNITPNLNQYLDIVNYKPSKYKLMSNLKSIPKKEDYVNDKILYKYDTGEYTIFTKKEVELILKKNPNYAGIFVSLKKIDDDTNILKI